ncbi:MAG: carbohydrate kinase family protein [Myxococcales bacterium]|nr:carbohydrate kinase family protein [Myxococcales bacterium]
MSILVSGSVALDHIMYFPDRFKEHILPDKLHMLNVSFNIESLVTHFGGVAGNIAYVLKLLGDDALILATAGSDFGPYAEWLERNAISRDGIRIIDDLRTAQGFVTTDLDDNQIWAFYVGAMARAHEARVQDVSQPIEQAIVSSNGREAMVEHARELKRRGVPTWIDPSHGLPVLSRDELIELIDGCAGYVVNDYEWSKTLEQTGLGEDEIARRCDAVVITKGDHGSEIRVDGDTIEIPPVAADQVVDPTGCGDAYRAGLLHARVRNHPWETAGRIGSLLGSLQVGVEGPQSLAIDLAVVKARYQSEFGANF